MDITARSGLNITVAYPQTNRKADTGKTLTWWPVLVDHYSSKDAELALEIMLCNRQKINAIKSENADILRFQQLIEQRRLLVENKHHFVNRLINTLKQYFLSPGIVLTSQQLIVLRANIPLA